MSAIGLERPASPTEQQDAAAPVLRALAICDLTDSTALINQLGDRRAAELLRRHDRLTRDLLQRHGGREIDKTDGFLMIFERPVQAVAFALDYQRRLGELGKQENVPLRARVGIHVGEIVLWKNSASDIGRGAKPVEAEGMVKPVAARLMSIARPGQILLSGVAYTLARRAHSEMGDYPALRWRAHGNYRFKGVPDPVQVYEVGEQDIAPFKPPAWTGKAHREIPWWRRPSTLVIEAAAAVAVIAVPAWVVLRSPPAIAFAQRDWVVVGDLKNLTSDSNFNESLQSAFRIGLEQSRYVNVLADLKARETLKLMQRDPDKTAIDREIGSEIAIRDGVRALILPSVAEIGGRVRVTAEVVDPRTQTTVYSESADGVGESSVLSSLDKVNAQLRVRLGEALASVTRESQPLEQVATKNLDALKAYSLGDKAYDKEDVKTALDFYEQAIKLDPGFARVYVRQSKTLSWIGRKADAWKALTSAELHTDRLSPRDILDLDAWKASLNGPQSVAIDKWKSLTLLYPDFLNAQGHYAYFLRQFANSYGLAAVAAATKCASPLSPSESYCHQLLGLLYLGNERYDDAFKQFVASDMKGSSTTADRARALAAKMQFAKAGEFLQHASSGSRWLDVEARMTPIAISLDQGRFEEARKQIADARNVAATFDAPLSNRFLGVEAGIAPLIGSDPRTKAGEYASAVVQELNQAAPASRVDSQLAVLFAAYLAAHAGNVPLAEDLLARVGPEPMSGEYLALAKLLQVVKAEIARMQGRPSEAIELIKKNLDDSALCLAHVVLMEAYAANHDFAAARDEAKWLTQHRGRAYAEYAQGERLLPYNVVQTDLGWLSMAEFSARVGDKSEARTALEEFLRRWPSVENQSGVIGMRLRALRAELG